MNLQRRAQIILHWIALGCAVGVASGIASAVFLLMLDRATRFRSAHEVIVYALPVAGIVIGIVYERWGQPIKGGNNLVLDTIHDDSKQLPIRMAPMLPVGTVVTHLFGGSAGREGTAVQMGASLADAISHRLNLHHEGRRPLLAAGIAGASGRCSARRSPECSSGSRSCCLYSRDARLRALLPRDERARR
jgi:H+/Cl- antiporter ClcA